MTNIIDTEKIFQLKQEIYKLLEERPEYIPFQRLIEEKLAKAGSNHNRMAVLDSMMREKVLELHDAMVELSRSINKLFNLK